MRRFPLLFLILLLGTPLYSWTVTWTQNPDNPIYTGDLYITESYYVAYSPAVVVLLDERISDTSTTNFRFFWGETGGTGRDVVRTGTHADGSSITRASGTVISAGNGQSWATNHNNDPSCVKVGSTYYLYFTGQYPTTGDQIGVATASTPTGPWTMYASNPVLARNYDAVEANCSEPSVIYEDNTFKMWYTIIEGGPYYRKIGYATSSDGYSWTRHGPIQDTATGVDLWDNIAPSVRRLNATTLIMAACIGQGDSTYTGVSSFAHRIGRTVRLFISSDGINWTLIDNETLPTQAWCTQSIITPELVKLSEGNWRCYYGGVYNNTWQTMRIGYADFNITEQGSNISIISGYSGTASWQ